MKNRFAVFIAASKGQITDFTYLGGGINIDKQNRKIYWTDSGANRIRRANIDGSSIEDLVDTGYGSNARGLVLDTNRGQMFWVDTADPGCVISGTCQGSMIASANMDGSNIEVHVHRSLGHDNLLLNSTGIALDIQNRQIYWTDYSDNCGIKRVDVESSVVEEVLCAEGTWGIATFSD